WQRRCDAPDPLVVVVRDVHAAIGPDGDVLRRPHLRLGRRPSITGEARRVATGDRRDDPIRSDPANPVCERLADVDRSVRAGRQTSRGLEPRLARRSAVTPLPGTAALARNRRNGPIGAERVDPVVTRYRP